MRRREFIAFTAAFIAALVRHAERDPQSPAGALVVVNQIENANDTFRDLNALIPGKVAVWTSENDPSCRLKDEDRKVPRDKLPAQFTKDQLQHYPVAIVTHAFYSHAGNHKARIMLHDGKLQPRAFTAIDERYEDVTIYDVTLSEAEKVREAIWADPQHSQAIGPHMEALCKFMRANSGPGRSLEMPRPNEGDEQGDERGTLADELAFFTTEPAADYVRHRPSVPAVSHVFGFARALASGYAFLSRPAAGITCFTGYENKFTVDAGTMLLDATADLDGIVQICPWRVPHPVPRARYDNLHIVCVPSCVPKNQRLKNYLATPKNRRAYARWLTDLIKTP
jgi:hypothetical protein